jgi:beta-hydroxylase
MLATILSPKLIVLWMFIGSTLYTHFRGRERLKFTRQLFDHSTFMSPINNFMYLFSKVPTKPYLDRKNFPELDIFDKNWDVIRDEGLKLMEQGYIGRSYKYDDAGFNSFFRTGWKRFYLKWYSVGILDSASKLCPKTVELIKQVPNLNGAMYTLLPAGARLGRHRDPYAGSLRYHLGLDTPNSENCFILVDGQKYSWRDGQSVLFDETYIHEAENKTPKDRLIFFCDVRRPMRNKFTNWLNAKISYLVMAGSATKNVEGEHVGWLNKIFNYAYRVRLVGKSIKKSNRSLYKVIKFFWLFGIAALILYLVL